MLGRLLREDTEIPAKNVNESNEKKVEIAMNTKLTADNEGKEKEGNDKGDNP